MIGQTLSHYRIVAKLGEGGMGVLYRARDTRLDRNVAIKVLRPEALRNPDRRRRLVQEAKAASALNHPHIVTVYDVGQARVDGQDVDFIAMECLEGTSLDRLLAERRLGLVEALDYAIQIAQALAAAHQAGIVHRDVKPANVMVSDAGQVKVLDFGLAKLMERDGSDFVGPTETGADPQTAASPKTRAGALLGTAAYMSPEQADEHDLDARSDIFSFGSVLYEMLAGRRPFQGHSRISTLTAILRDAPLSLKSLRPEAPRDLERIVLRCLAKDRQDRYATAGELLLDLVSSRAQLAARTSGWRAALRQPRYALPLGIAAVALLSVLIGLWTRSARVRWARDVALPEIERLVAQNDYYQAYWLARQAENHLPGHAQLERFWKDRCFLQSVRTTPPGAEVFLKSYRDRTGDWMPIGRTPLEEVQMPFELLRLRITKDGFEPLEVTTDPNGRGRTLEYTLDARGGLPAGMVRVRGGPVRFRNHPAVEVDDFWLDRHEVTNRQYKEFVDQGGYRTQSYWKQPLVKDGRTLSWEEATSGFRDATGRSGPATWQLGTFADGHDEFPVDGVSWFEAAAYAEFAGRALPTVYHWLRAADAGLFAPFSDIIESSNFGGRGAAPAGRHRGISPYGNYDMAGNVKEWCWNQGGGGRYILGGAWYDSGQSYFGDERQSPWARDPGNGFRCARYGVPLSPDLKASIEAVSRDYSAKRPVSDDEFQSYVRFYSYDRTQLKPAVEGIEEAPHWRRERVSFEAAYGRERVLAHLFLPRNAKPPYQTVVYHTGTEGRLLRSSDNLRMAQFDFIILSGRAVLCPVYKGMFERRLPKAIEGPSGFRDQVVQVVKDSRRSLDYLETRRDIDPTKLAVLGVSTPIGVFQLALDKRPRAGVLHSVGLPPGLMQSMGWDIPPEIDPIHFAPRVQAPVLMLNGRYDPTFPPETHQKPLFQRLGTPEKDKRHVLFDCGHSLLRTHDAVRETLAWLDRYLGAVDIQASPGPTP
jgi:cephalosporin-C deacetylase-like acetyl esterase/predicted Ser/Thr protein kinase